MLRLTGEARFAEQLEHVILNQLCAAQRPDGEAWGYYVEMEGKKPYSSTLDGHCCLSSGPRGIALIPTFAVTTDADGAVVNLYDAGSADLRLRDGAAVKLRIDTRYPAAEKIVIGVDAAAPDDFTLKLRIPAWCNRPSMRINDQPSDLKLAGGNYASVRRTWKKGDEVEVSFPLRCRVVVGDHQNQNKAAVLYGPLVLALDQALAEGKDINSLALASSEGFALAVTPEPAPERLRTWPGAQTFVIAGVDRQTSAATQLRLAPFADAGIAGTSYKVWLPLLSEK